MGDHRDLLKCSVIQSPQVIRSNTNKVIRTVLNALQKDFTHTHTHTLTKHKKIKSSLCTFRKFLYTSE